MLFGSVVALSLVVLMLTFTLLGRDRVVVLIPPDLSAETEIARGRAGQDYTKAWGLHVATLLGNVTPGNGDFIKDAIYPLLSPDIHGDVTTAIERQLDQLARDRVSLRFEPRRVVQDGNLVFVFGYGITSAIGGKNKSRQERTYEIEMEIERHRPVIRSLRTYEGEPRPGDKTALSLPPEARS